MAKQYQSLHPVKYYRDYLSQNVRPDGRDFEKFRPIIVNVSSITTADGSAITKVGKSSVICGIKAELCRPKAATPNEGFIVPNLDLTPLCSAKFKSGPPSDQAQVLTQLLADVIENSKCIDLKDLCIHPDKLAWCLYVDLICLDYDGSIIDASLISLIGALKSATLPQIEYDNALDKKTVNLEVRKPIPIHCTPVATTFVVFDDNIILCDPTAEEEDLCTGMMTIVMKDDELCYMHKPGGSSLSDEQLFNCIEISRKRSPLISELINTAIQSVER